MKRKEVYKLIDAERDYQDLKWDDLDNVNSVGDFLIYIETYLNNAKRENNPRFPNESLVNIRKLTALGVAAMEKFGAPERSSVSWWIDHK